MVQQMANPQSVTSLRRQVLEYTHEHEPKLFIQKKKQQHKVKLLARKSINYERSKKSQTHKQNVQLLARKSINCEQQKITKSQTKSTLLARKSTNCEWKNKTV